MQSHFNPDLPAVREGAQADVASAFSNFVSSSAVSVSALTRRFALSAMMGGVVSLLAACGQSGAQGPGAAMPPPEVNVVQVEARDLPQTFEYVGQTAGSRETEVRARVSGILEKRLYEEGSVVKANTPLFQISPANFESQLAANEAQVQLAQARFQQAQRELNRISPLLAEKAVSQKEVDDAKSALEVAQASLQQARAQLADSRLNLGYTKVLAPISGIVGNALKADGSLVTASDSLLTTLVQTDPMYVNFTVSESDWLAMRREQAAGRLQLPAKMAAHGSPAFAVKLKLADGSLYPLAGSMNFTSAKINPANGAYEARAVVANPDAALRPGQFVRVQLEGGKRLKAIAVPQRAVQDGPMGKMVFVVEADNKLGVRPVELDGWNNGLWIVTRGLKGGERVLVDGVIKAHNPGMTVKPVLISAEPAHTPAAASASAASAAK